ncbi:MAG: DNA polymerase III [Candidatus Nealsonbacteria bacterium RIFOXYB1_FULL_40_15]|uniref:DNA polymerase beta n=1 Tax=Candidatus Nealsonbacteria bacterium RIFOXYB1_FULL_40_15 TaxID=1801677 RepID=A0A1G2EME6_9BACT|nr:MAG: DNA polymerase III [Candidatus Nealsonbacteria bacterium RIFOXYB1_FULL_40_15]OGZ28483.1 MAG: DNA polymerase III [Candidatus Nealsonbacteria bacterium RIFOXYD1_FULL_39_11]
MANRELSKIFREIAGFLRMDNIPFKPQAYQRAAKVLDGLEDDAGEIYKRGGIEAVKNIEGVGESIASKIEEYVRTGKIKSYEELKRRMPLDLSEIIRIEGMGVKKARTLYLKLGVKNIKELEKAAKDHKISGLEGFGAVSEKNILEGIGFLKSKKGRFLLGDVFFIVENLVKELGGLEEVKRVEPAGSFRRRKETVGDIDILAVSENPGRVIDFFSSRNEVAKVWGRGATKCSVRIKDGFDIDLRVVPEKCYGSALQYFTGSKEHNVATRRIAIAKGLKLSEYGLFKGKTQIAGRTEQDVYKKLGMQWIPPEMRENKGEAELALEDRIPELIGYKDIKGDLHCHSDWDGGKNSIREIAESAEKMGYEYVGIADHTKYLKIERGLDEDQIRKRNKEIDKLNKTSKIRILKGCEANILKDGSLDIKGDVLAELDFVIAGVHSSLKMEEKYMTERIIKAIKDPNVDIISHPTGRIIQKRDECRINMEEIFKAAKDFNKVLEINSFPERLDLKDEYIRRAKEKGVKMIINTDSHIISHLGYITLGISQARRGWAEKKDIINTQPLERILEYFKR